MYILSNTVTYNNNRRSTLNIQNYPKHTKIDVAPESDYRSTCTHSYKRRKFQILPL